MLQISQERSLLLPIIRSRLHEGLGKILAHHHILPPDDVCLALEALDMLGLNSMRCCDVCMSEEDYIAYELMKRGNAFHDENYEDEDASDCPSDIEDESEKAYYRKNTRRAIIDYLVQPPLIQNLTTLLEIPNAQVFLGAIMVLHKFASTHGYNHVLIEVTALSGRALEHVVENLQSQDGRICMACLALVKQLATQQPGRDAMLTTRVCDMLMPLISGADATNSKIFTLALSSFVALAQDGSKPNVSFDLGPTPPKNHLYNDLLALLTTDGASPLVSIEHLLDMKVMKFVVNFLVRPENTALFFDLSNQHKQMGAVVLHRIFLHKECCRKLTLQPVLDYFAYSIQTMFTSMIEHRYGHDAAERLLFFSSLQGACRGLAQIANITEGGAELVLATISHQNIYKEIEELLRFPSVKLDDTFGPKIECSDAAATLVASVSCEPLREKHPEADNECALELKDDVEAVLGTLTRVAEQMAEPLETIVHSCPSKDAVANASLALAKLSSTNVTCDILLEQGVAKIAASMFPEKPSILEGPMGSKHIMDEIYDVQAKYKRDGEVDQVSDRETRKTRPIIVSRSGDLRRSLL